MSKQDELRDMLTITQSKYEIQQQSFQRIILQENHLRNELARLDALHRQSLTKIEEAGEMRTIGADIIWQGWVGRSKSQLNLQLAKVLAVKLHHLAQVKQAYGKVVVTQELVNQSVAKAKNKKAKDILSQAIQLSIRT